MVSSFTYSIAVPAYYVTLCTVALVASRIGGRYERSMAFVLIAGSLATVLAQCISRRYVPLALFTIIDVAMAAGFLRILRRYRRPWVWGAVVAQCLAAAVDLLERFHVNAAGMAYLNGGNFLNYAIMAALLYGCLRRRYGPPHALPERPPLPALQPEDAKITRRL